MTSDTLNVYDNSETRTPILVAYALYERAGCAGGAKEHWYKPTKWERYVPIITK